MSPKLKIDRQEEPNLTRFVLSGVIDEDADFKSAFNNLKSDAVVIDFGGIELINSCGVREWVQAVQKIPKTLNLIYENCAPRVIEQVNYVANFLGNGKIVSFFAPYYCAKCKKEANALLKVEALRRSLPAKAPTEKCPTCKGAMEFDDIETEYFSFLEND
ncbi:MAG: hypothetical protein K8R69_07745 [Deltaproteobacteria bacterium]|nr:hypothetical protein [Deltaproteobacteria bacterium]